jgi:hypothetical protein
MPRGPPHPLPVAAVLEARRPQRRKGEQLVHRVRRPQLGPWGLIAQNPGYIGKLIAHCRWPLIHGKLGWIKGI